MKIAWLVWEQEGDVFPILVPDGHAKLNQCHCKLRIVYAEAIYDAC